MRNLIKEYVCDIGNQIGNYIDNKLAIGWPKITKSQKCYRNLYIDACHYTYVIDYDKHKTILCRHNDTRPCVHKTLNCILELNHKDVRDTFDRFNKLMTLK